MRYSVSTVPRAYTEHTVNSATWYAELAAVSTVCRCRLDDEDDGNDVGTGADTDLHLCWLCSGERVVGALRSRTRQHKA